MRKLTYEIPDTAHPYPDDEVGPMGPSAPLIPFVPDLLDPAGLSGRTVEEWTPSAGTYGMGGPGFLGFRLGGDWLVIAIWGAADWFRLDGRLLADHFWERHGRDRPWTDDAGADGGTLFIGWQITAARLERDSITLEFNGRHILCLASDPDDRPLYEGDGSPRQVEDDDDLRTVVFVAPTNEIWV